jgi:TIR domain/Pentapeptide repeats (8 copies)
VCRQLFFLIQPDFAGSNLAGKKLYRADLRSADLGGADLNEAILGGADLRGANLWGANLYRTDLRGADLTSAVLHGTVFGATTLSEVKGLDQCRHVGPSIVDFETLKNSGPLPEVFLRGVGLPDNLIEYLPSLFNQAVQLYSCFISYSTKDDEFAKRLHADLQNNGVRCWFAPHDLPIGAKTWDTIDEAIKLRDKVLLILSKNSIESDWVEDEVQKAFAEERDRKELVLFPVRIDDAVTETPEPWARKFRDQRHIGDFRRWKDHDAYKQSFERVLRDLTVKPKAP